MAHSEFENFDKGMRKILSVSHEEFLRREKKWKIKYGRPRGKRKVKSSALRRASCVKD
jgi:hypothetical protein